MAAWHFFVLTNQILYKLYSLTTWYQHSCQTKCIQMDVIRNRVKDQILFVNSRNIYIDCRTIYASEWKTNQCVCMACVCMNRAVCVFPHSCTQTCWQAGTLHCSGVPVCLAVCSFFQDILFLLSVRLSLAFRVQFEPTVLDLLLYWKY